MGEPGLLNYLGQVLRSVREEAGVDQSTIAVRAEVSRSVVSRLETGRRWPEAGPDRLVNAYAVECDASWLVPWERAIELAREADRD